MTTEQHCRAFNCILVGDAGVGKLELLKTALVSQLYRGEFVDSYRKSSSIEVETLGFVTDTGPVYCQVINMPSNVAWPNKDRRIQGAIIMFDVTRRITYKNVERWNCNITELFGNIPRVLVESKVDVRSRSIRRAQVNFPLKHKMEYFEISCKTSSGLRRPFLCLASKVGIMGRVSCSRKPDWTQFPTEIWQMVLDYVLHPFHLIGPTGHTGRHLKPLAREDERHALMATSKLFKDNTLEWYFGREARISLVTAFFSELESWRSWTTRRTLSSDRQRLKNQGLIYPDPWSKNIVGTFPSIPRLPVTIIAGLRKVVFDFTRDGEDHPIINELARIWQQENHLISIKLFVPPRKPSLPKLEPSPAAQQTVESLISIDYLRQKICWDASDLLGRPGRFSALEYAVIKRDGELVATIISQCPEAVEKVSLELVIETARADTLSAFLKTGRADVTQFAGSGLYLAAALNTGKEELIDLLLDNGVALYVKYLDDLSLEARDLYDRKVLTRAFSVGAERQWGDPL